MTARAGTFPTLDPSFYGTAQLVLSSIEVSLAIIAASLPVFWPMMNFGWGDIFVTTVITVQHQDGNDVDDAAKSYRNQWSCDAKAEPCRTEVKDIPMVKTKREERYEDMEALVIKPLPDFKTWKAAKDEAKALVTTPLPDSKTWKMARENRRSSSIYTSTVC